jgi:PAS domain S-box-containing protein
VFIEKEKEAEQNNSIFNVEVRCYDATGNIRWLQITSTPRALENGQIVWDGFHVDITDRKQASEKINLANERFELIATATNDVVWDWDLVTNKLWWNQNYFDVFGFDKNNAPLDIDSWRNNIHPDDRKRVKERVNKIIAAGETFWDDEFRCLKSNGEIVYIYDRGFVQYDKSGKPLRMTGSMLDFTERKKQKMPEDEQKKNTAPLLNRLPMPY